MIKVLIIEDSGFMRIMLSDKLREDGSISIIGTANNGKEGVRKALEQRPDVVICDLIMPGYDGLYVVKHLMRKMPVPILILSSLEKTNSLVFDALQSGAVDFVRKSAIDDRVDGMHKLIELVKINSEIKLIEVQDTGVNKHHHTFDADLRYQVITIGASTGGPSTIEAIVKKLPSNLDVPVIIAQHMPHSFLVSFAERMSRYTSIPVKIPKNGEEVQGNTIYIAPGFSNLKVIKNLSTEVPIFRYSEKQFREFNNPSIDCVFDSIAQTFGEKSIGVLLTGMGKDGTEGLKSIKNSGGYVITQDESTSVVYGMPKSALNAGVVDVQLKMNEISGYLVNCL